MRKPAGYPSVGIDHYCPVMGISLMPKPFSDMVLATKMGGIDLNLHWPAKHVFHLFGEDSAREIGKNHLRWNNWSRRVERPPKLPHRSISTKFPLYPFYQEKDFLFPRLGVTAGGCVKLPATILHIRIISPQRFLVSPLRTSHEIVCCVLTVANHP
jgi:hypothetical protein